MWCHIDKRVNTWEAFWMAETSPAWVAKAEKKHERQRARTTKYKDVLVIFFQMVHPLF